MSVLLIPDGLGEGEKSGEEEKKRSSLAEDAL